MEALPNGAAETAPWRVSMPSICTHAVAGTNGASAISPIGPHTRAAAAVRNAEGFMQVEVRDVRADKARRGNANLGVHVRAIEINLAAKLMHHFAHFANGLFVNAVGGRIGHHDAGEVRRMLLGFRPQIRQIDIAVLSQATTTTCIPAICAEAGLVPCAELGIRQISRCPSLRLSVVTNCQQARVFALRAGVRLHADRIIAGQLTSQSES